MKEGLKAAAVFIGTVIGAGFATGQEVALYFGKSSPIIAVLAGLILGALCAFFMYLGSIAKETDDTQLFLPARGRVFSNVIMFICAFITFTAMFSGAEVLIKSTFGYEHTGILTVVTAGVITAGGLKRVKILDAIAVPLIVVMIALIFIKNGVSVKGGNLNPLNAVAYASMNIMIAGGVVTRLGRGANKKCIVTAGCVSGVILAGLLLMIFLSVSSGGEMPLYETAKRLGLQTVAGAIVLLAVFTTMVSAMETSSECIKTIVPDKRLAVLTVCLMAYPLTCIFTFSQIVDFFYPVVSVFGALMVIFGTVYFLRRKYSYN